MFSELLFELKKLEEKVYWRLCVKLRLTKITQINGILPLHRSPSHRFPKMGRGLAHFIAPDDECWFSWLRSPISSLKCSCAKVIAGEGEELVEFE